METANKTNSYRKLVLRTVKENGKLVLSISQLEDVVNANIREDPRVLFRYCHSIRVKKHNGQFEFTLEPNFNLCSDYNSNHGCTKLCIDIHCCLHYLQKDCKFKNKCNFSHDLKSSHNLAILKNNYMDKIDEELLIGFLKTKYLTPTRSLICKGYNTSTNCKFGADCTCLHLCSFYITNECTFGKKCKRSHDLKDTKIQEVLQERGFNVNQPISNVLNDIRRSLEILQDNNTNSISCDNNRVIAFLPMLSNMEKAQKPDICTDEAPLICTFYLRKRCNFKELCTKFHQPNNLPYHWQFKNQTGKWVDLPQNKDIENSYCNCEDNIHIFLDTTTVMLNLNDLNYILYDLDCASGKIRRLSTDQQRDASKDLLYLTVWEWFWHENKDVWIKYEDENGYPSSETIETAFHKNRGDPLQFQTKHWKYEIDFENMIQMNKQTGQIRKLKRRPDVFDEKAQRPKSISHFMKTEDMKSIRIEFPSNWLLASGSARHDSYNIVDVPNTGSTANEFYKMDKIFKETTQRSIKTLKRIENSELWSFFIMRQDSLKKKSEICGTEKYLFHGTRVQHVEAICHQGFDFRLNGMSSGTSYGKGSYFARDALYSLKYSDCNKMFIARVIVGQSIRGSPTYTRPPLRNSSKHDTFESCVDKESDPSIYVIFDNSQAYPQYLVEY